jgi:hypothetical protein
MKVMNIISSAYRATLEEQDDTVVWLTHALRRAGADIDVLLRAAAANYVVEGQSVSPLAIGGRVQRNAPEVHGQVRDLAAGGARIFVLEEDLERYGLLDCPKLTAARIVGSDELPHLLKSYDSVWHW